MPMPVGAVSPVDASLQAQFTLGGVEVVDGGRFDTANGWSIGGGNPFWDSFSMGNGPCVFYGGVGAPIAAQPSWLSMASLAIGVPFSLVVAFRGDLPGDFCELSANVAAGRGVEFRDSGGWTARINGPTALSFNDNAAGQLWGCDNNVHYAILTCDGTTTALYVDGVQVVVSTDGVAPGSSAFSVASTIGAGHGGILPLTGAIGAIYPYTRALSLSERNAVDTYVRGIWRLTNVNQAILYNMIVNGASISQGAHTASDTQNGPNYPYTYVALARQLGNRFASSSNVAVSGTTLVFNQSQWTATWKNSLIPGGHNIAILGGDAANNDLGGGASVATTNANMQSLAQRMSADMSAASGGNPQHLFIFVPETGGLNAGIPAVNTNTRANFLTWGAANVVMHLIDAGNDTVLATAPGFPSYFAVDNTHLAKPGQQRVATIFQNALLAAGL